MTDFSALGFDPAPGDVATLSGYVDALTTSCEGVDDALSTMDGSGGAERLAPAIVEEVDRSAGEAG